VNRRFRVVVCRGPECGDRRGSRAVYDAFRRVIDARGLASRCELGWQSCFGRCTQGPNVLVREIVDGGSDVPRATALYNGMDAMTVDEVVSEHVERGVVVRRLILGTLSFLAIALSVLGAAGCKGKTKKEDTQETLDKLASLQDQLKAKDELITQLRNANAELTLGTSGGTTPAGEDEWVFRIEGDALVIVAKPGGGGGASEQVATGSAEEFLGQVEKSRGNIQKCYEQALKKSSGLASRTVNLKLVASFASTGKFKAVSFEPDLPEAFDTCLRTVAAKWKMPPAKGSMRFAANVKLTPT
jgi:(2Fe-2S) ferredoxin